MSLSDTSGLTIDSSPSPLRETLESNSHQIRLSSDNATFVDPTIFLTEGGNFFTLDLGVLSSPVGITNIEWTTAPFPPVPLQFGTQIYLKILFSGDEVTITDNSRLLLPGGATIDVANGDIFQFLHVGNAGLSPIFELIEYFSGGSPGVNAGWNLLAATTITTAVSTVDFESILDTTNGEFAVVITNCEVDDVNETMTIRLGDGATYANGWIYATDQTNTNVTTTHLSINTSGFNAMHTADFHAGSGTNNVRITDLIVYVSMNSRSPQVNWYGTTIDRITTNVIDRSSLVTGGGCGSDTTLAYNSIRFASSDTGTGGLMTSGTFRLFEI